MNIDNLPSVNVYLTVTLKGSNATIPNNSHVKDIKVVNIGEIITLFSGNTIDVSSCITCLCGCDTVKGKQSVKVNSITINTLADICNSLLDQQSPNNKLVNDPIVNSSHKLIPTSTFQFQTLDFEKSGVGGLSHQVETIFRRIFLPFILGDKGEIYGLKPCRGVLLHGPLVICNFELQNSKTALARGLAKLLNEDAVVTLINGPELLNKFVGQSEENVRKLYLPALKDPSKLHVFIFDEFCVSRTVLRTVRFNCEKARFCW
jgi:hypothetical protein